nr:hypothetical protein [Xylella fastidiosa]
MSRRSSSSDSAVYVNFSERERRADVEKAARLYETRRDRVEPSYVFPAPSGEKGLARTVIRAKRVLLGLILFLSII